MGDDGRERAREFPATLLQLAGMSYPEVERRLAAGGLLAGTSPAGRDGPGLQRIVALLGALEVDPLDFFRLLFPEPEPGRTAADLPARIAAILAEVSPECGPQPSLPASRPLDPAELERRVKAAIRETLDGPEDPE